MDTFTAFGPLFVEGYRTTLLVTGLSMAVALAIALIFGSARVSHTRVVRRTSEVVVEFLRGTSAIVQLFWVFYGLPILIGVQIAPVVAAVAVLGLNIGSYGAEVVRGAINAISPGQRDAARSLGLSPFRTLRRVIIPQAVPRMLPPFGNLAIDIMKGTALLGFVQVQELTFWAEQARMTAGTPLTVYLFVLVVYFITSVGIALLFRFVEAQTTLRRTEREKSVNGKAGLARTVFSWGGTR